MSPRTKKWMTYLGLAFGAIALVTIGAMIHFYSYAKESTTLQASLEALERGMVPEETSDYKSRIEMALLQENLKITLGGYTNTSKVRGITYNTALVLKADGTYDYAMTVGTERVYKTYKHAGRWWMQGRVLHTILLEGDNFLVAPSTRDRVTPSREILLEATPQHFLLQAQYSPQPVRFEKADDNAASISLKRDPASASAVPSNTASSASQP